jgi:hypothetical protein
MLPRALRTMEGSQGKRSKRAKCSTPARAVVSCDDVPGTTPRPHEQRIQRQVWQERTAPLSQIGSTLSPFRFRAGKRRDGPANGLRLYCAVETTPRHAVARSRRPTTRRSGVSQFRSTSQGIPASPAPLEGRLLALEDQHYGRLRQFGLGRLRHRSLAGFSVRSPLVLGHEPASTIGRRHDPRATVSWRPRVVATTMRRLRQEGDRPAENRFPFPILTGGERSERSGPRRHPQSSWPRRARGQAEADPGVERSVGA